MTDTIDVQSPAGDSISARLSAAREQRQTHRTLELSLPGYEGMLRAVFRPIPGEQFKRISKRMTGSVLGTSDASLQDANADLLIAACDHIVYVDPESGDRTTLEEAMNDGDGPVRFDARLASFLKLSATSARGVLLASMNVPQPEAAVSGLGAQVMAWMGGERDAAAEEVLGE